MKERDALRVEMAEARKQIAVCEEELGRALGLASEFRRKVGKFQGDLRNSRCIHEDISTISLHKTSSATDLVI